MYHYPELAQELNSVLSKLRKEIPDTVSGFGQMSKAVAGDGALSKKHKELIAMGIGIAARCQGCLTFHAKALVAMQCSRAEFLEMLQVAIYMGGGPSLMTAAEALKAFEDFGGEKAAEVVG